MAGHRIPVMLACCLILLGCVQDASPAATTGACPEDSVLVEDGSGECKCVSPCPKHDCQPGQQPVRLREASPESPGKCCPLYECRDRDVINYLSPEDLATGHCLDDSGQVHENGSHWQELGDPCIECSCESGSRHCLAAMCRSCENPLPREPDECCPRCPSPPSTPPCPTPIELCRDCERASNRDPDTGCPICRCKDRDLENELGNDEFGEVESDDDDDSEEVECPGLRECEKICKYGRLKDENGCEVCECRDQLRQGGCPSELLCDKKCPEGYAKDLQGCPVCWRCRDECLDERNVTHPLGSTWRNDPCRSCSCESEHRIFCNDTVCSAGCADPRNTRDCCNGCPPITYMLDEWRHWRMIPLILISALVLLSLLMVIIMLRLWSKARLSTSSRQYYKCSPIYDNSHLPVLQQANFNTIFN